MTDESPFEKARISKGYPLDDFENADLSKVLGRVTWTDASSNPLSDFQTAVDMIANQTGFSQSVIITDAKTKERYERWMRISAALYELLEMTPRKSRTRRYQIQRLLGRSRTLILFPRVHRTKLRALGRYQDWKHRRDLYWEC